MKNVLWSSLVFGLVLISLGLAGFFGHAMAIVAACGLVAVQSAEMRR